MTCNVSGILSHHGEITLLIASAALVCNVPLGYLREGVRKFSPAWFLFVHLSIPLIAGFRIFNHLHNWVIPVFIACAVVGQILGGRLRRRRMRG
ncbi:MAG TPA: hypothetical protein VGK27_05430 [Candidatus Deferrimicrobiaceae bacterium]|jgi:hypothetical protein